jgi:hypothetical protein
MNTSIDCAMWSTDSKSLIFGTFTLPANIIYTVNADGSDLQQIDPGMVATDPIWCGGLIVFNHGFFNATGNWEEHIYKMNPDGSGITQLTFSSFFEDWPACSPDGRWMFYQYDTNGVDSYVSVVPLAGGTPVRLTGSSFGMPTVSADWTLGFQPGYQWLGGTVQHATPYIDSFSIGDGSIPAPAGFPIAYKPPKSCPPLKFFGVRGSGETSTDDGGYGSTVGEAEHTLATLVPHLAPTAINYPAIPVGYKLADYGTEYQKSVAAGKTALHNAVMAFNTRCPTTYMVISGYSQGAQVAGDVTDTLAQSVRNTWRPICSSATRGSTRTKAPLMPRSATTPRCRASTNGSIRPCGTSPPTWSPEPARIALSTIRCAITAKPTWPAVQRLRAAARTSFTSRRSGPPRPLPGPRRSGTRSAANYRPKNADQVRIEGGAGDLQQHACPRNVAPASFPASMNP